MKPYSVTRCFQREVRFNVLSAMVLLFIVFTETITLPIFPLIYKLHKLDHKRNWGGRAVP